MYKKWLFETVISTPFENPFQNKHNLFTLETRHRHNSVLATKGYESSLILFHLDQRSIVASWVLAIKNVDPPLTGDKPDVMNAPYVKVFESSVTAIATDSYGRAWCGAVDGGIALLTIDEVGGVGRHSEL